MCLNAEVEPPDCVFPRALRTGQGRLLCGIDPLGASQAELRKVVGRIGRQLELQYEQLHGSRSTVFKQCLDPTVEALHRACRRQRREARDEALRGPGLDLLTLTPPYEEIDYDELMASVASSPLLNADCVVVVEYPVERGKPPFRIGELVGVRNRRYGRTALAFYAFKPSGALEALRPRPEEFEEFS